MTVLKIVVGASISLSSGLSGSDRLQRQHDEADDEHHRVEQQQGDGVLLPVLRPGVEPLLEPAQPARRHGSGRP